MVKHWAEIIYHERRHEHEPDGVDFYTNLDLVKQNNNSKGIIVTKWGKENLETCFHCVTGEGLYDILPWWAEMQNFFESDLGLTAWLPYPCILMSMSNLRRHVDKGRPTAFNYPIFGDTVTTNHLWYTFGAPDDKYNESYYYKPGESILIDTTYEHGGFANPGHTPFELRAICNMGFKDDYDVCYNKIQAAFEDGSIEKIL